MNQMIDHTNQHIVPFVSATSNLIRLNTKWQEQLKTEKEKIRRILITGNDGHADDTLDHDAVKYAVVTSINSNNYTSNTLENYGSILPVVAVTTGYPTQKSIIDEYTLNREQRAAFMIITSHLEGDKRCRTGIFFILQK
jgi:hypothetical protein